jgi:nicotinate phosphoribosyltransferase
MTGQKIAYDTSERMINTATNLSQNGAKWIDFGTRRRFSKEVQDAVVMNMKQYPGFLGTSNVFFAYKHNVKAHGTYSHQAIMAMSALYGAKLADKMWNKLWAEHFNGNLGTALGDTFGTDTFLKSFDSYFARLFDGVRQDSGIPEVWAEKMLGHYRSMNIDPKSKKFTFSDNLNDEKYIKLHHKYKDVCLPTAGIGTFLTNNIHDVKPLNMVIKLSRAKPYNFDWVDVVKLSDTHGKYTGKPEAIEFVKRELGII